MVQEQDIKKLVVSTSPKTDVIGFKFNGCVSLKFLGIHTCFL